MNTVKCPRCNLTNWACDTCKRCGLIFSSGRAHVQGFAPAAPFGSGERDYANANFDRQYSSHSVVNSGQPKTGMAIASMVLGIAGFALCFVTAPVGLVLGIVSLVRANKRPAEYGGQGYAIAGIVTGAIATLFIPIIAAIAIPNLLAARRAANEGSAISALRTLHAAEHTYIATMGAGSCGELNQLSSSQLIDQTLASGRRSGYRFEVAFSSQKQQCDVYATPETTSTGTRSFIITDDGIMRASNRRGAKADRFDPVLGN